MFFYFVLGGRSILTFIFVGQETLFALIFREKSAFEQSQIGAYVCYDSILFFSFHCAQNFISE